MSTQTSMPIPAVFRKFRTLASAERVAAHGDEIYRIALLSDDDDDGKTLGYVVCDPMAWTDEDEDNLGRSMRRKISLSPLEKVYGPAVLAAARKAFA